MPVTIGVEMVDRSSKANAAKSRTVSGVAGFSNMIAGDGARAARFDYNDRRGQWRRKSEERVYNERREGIMEMEALKRSVPAALCFGVRVGSRKPNDACKGDQFGQRR